MAQNLHLQGFDSYLSSTNNKTEVYNALIAVKHNKANIKIRDTSKITVCIVEDDENSAYALKQILLIAGIKEDNIVIVESGEQAVKTIIHYHLDLSFIDCHFKGKI